VEPKCQASTETGHRAGELRCEKFLYELKAGSVTTLMRPDGQPLVEQGRAHHAGQAGRRPPAHPRPRDGVPSQRHDHQQQGEADELGSRKTHEDVRPPGEDAAGETDTP
jgi:hypothetical protein